MVSKASDDLPEPLGPVTTVNFPSGRSTSTPLRLFWRAPRTSTQPHSDSAAIRSFSVTFEPTGDNSRLARASQILAPEIDVLLPYHRRPSRNPCGAFIRRTILATAAERISAPSKSSLEAAA